MKIYITGVSGTGKTSIAHALREKGISAIDLDEISHWQNKISNESVELEVGANDEWINNHDWICDIAQLKEFLSKSENSVTVGHTANQDEYLPFYDKVLVLSCKPETIVQRIGTRTDNDYGKHPDDLARILKWNEGFVAWMEGKGAKVIDGEEPIQKIVDNIISILK